MSASSVTRISKTYQHFGCILLPRIQIAHTCFVFHEASVKEFSGDDDESFTTNLVQGTCYQHKFTRIRLICSTSVYRRLAYKTAIDSACRSRARAVEEEFRIKCRHRRRPQNSRNRPAALHWIGARPLVCCARLPILVDPKHLHPPDGVYVSGECCSRAQLDLRQGSVSV